MRYPLGTDRQELERLHLQHRLWSDAAHALWRRAGVAPGSHVLDVGAGPGAATIDLAQLTTSAGRVVAIDESEDFIRHVRWEAETRGLEHVAAFVGNAHAIGAIDGGAIAPASFDVAYMRWVFCFLARPDEAARGVAAALKPSGALCVHDYFNYATMTAAPRRASHDKMVQATARSWRDNGGDPDVVGRLPRLLDEAGLDVVHLDVHQRIARPGEQMWHWAMTWWRSYTPKLVRAGYVTEDDVTAFFADLDAMTPAHDFVVMPPVYEVMARRRR